MELRPHDLLEIKSIQDLVSYSTAPEWVDKSLNKAPFVVVRRETLSEELVAVGIRGETRNERFADFLPYQKILRRITPEQLVDEKLWKDSMRKDSVAALNSLPLINELLYHHHNMLWGPTGSVGFELASCIPATTSTSDLDLIIRVPFEISTETAKQILNGLKIIPVRVDVQLETPKGAISLMEYEKGRGPILLRTKTGPLLINACDIWKPYKNFNVQV